MIPLFIHDDKKKSFYNGELITLSLIVLHICLVDALISIPTINTFLNPLSPKSDQHDNFSL